mmetsp:Transcript_115187/g.325467  ORF Transcript_115187/g.325467 Transcript_115187/m.325467 type:complete len:254 (+) Transcript_115187:481-1242(+)
MWLRRPSRVLIRPKGRLAVPSHKPSRREPKPAVAMTATSPTKILLISISSAALKTGGRASTSCVIASTRTLVLTITQCWLVKTSVQAHAIMATRRRMAERPMAPDASFGQMDVSTSGFCAMGSACKAPCFGRTAGCIPGVFRTILPRALARSRTERAKGGMDCLEQGGPSRKSNARSASRLVARRTRPQAMRKSSASIPERLLALRIAPLLNGARGLGRIRCQRGLTAGRLGRNRLAPVFAESRQGTEASRVC